MQYINKDLGSFNLHMINTDKFKTNILSNKKKFKTVLFGI